MEQQNYGNHRKIDPAFHFVLAPLTLLLLVGSLVYLGMSLAKGDRIFEAVLFVLGSIIACVHFLKLRVYALKAQDRAILAEESLRHYLLTEKKVDSRLTIKQIIALRFASDEELAALSAKTVNENLNPNDIKKAITHWKADHNRL